MPGTMPYLLHKSAYFEVIESLLETPAQRIAGRQQLISGAPLAGLLGLDSTNLGGPPVTAGGVVTKPGWGDKQAPDERVRHINQDWLGMSNAGGAWAPQPAAFPTGFWKGYQGDTDAILRAATVCAIEVSLNLPPAHPGDAIPDASTVERQWPIDVYWICQGPYFQCWVMWRQSGTGPTEGHVTLLITTPAADGHPLTSKITRPVKPSDPPYTSREYASPPPDDARLYTQGMWVIGHGDYNKTVVYSTAGSRHAQITVPGLQWRAADPTKVVCVSPAEWEGGVLPDGRPYASP